MKTILYATDYSSRSVNALKLANLLAKKFNARLIVLHVFDVPVSLASPGSVTYMKKEKKLFEEHRVRLSEFHEKYLAEEMNLVKPKIMVNENASIIAGIQEKARQTHADLIVVGTKGARGVKEFLLGSTTKALIKNTHVPILAVPEQFSFEEFKSITYATDFEQADIFAVQKLMSIVRAFNACVGIVHVTTQKEYAGDQKMQWFKEMLLQKVEYNKMEFKLIFSNHILEELKRYIQESNTSMLVLLERKNSSFFKRYLEADLIGNMVESIRIPLLIFSDLK